MKMETYLIENINKKLQDDKIALEILLNIRTFVKNFEGKKITKRALQPIAEIINEAYGFEVRGVYLEKSGNCYTVRYYKESYQEYNTVDLCLLEEWEGAISPFDLEWYDNNHEYRIKHLRERIEKLEKSEAQEKLVNVVAEKARALNAALEDFRNLNREDLMEPWKYDIDDCVNVRSLTRELRFDLV